MEFREWRHNYTEFVVNHRRDLHKLAIGFLLLSVPTAVAVDVVFDAHKAPAIMIGELGMATLAESLSRAGYERHPDVTDHTE